MVEISYSDNDADDEIDVVSDASPNCNQSLLLQKSDSRVRLVRSIKHKQASSSQTNLNSDSQGDKLYGDHCYVISTQPVHRSVDPSILGILTPTESSEDDDSSSSSSSNFHTLVKSQHGYKYRYHIRGDAKKRQLVRSNQSLIKKPGSPETSTANKSQTSNQTKFKFHMKFKSHKPRSILRQKSQVSQYGKRKAAVKNSFCPNPTQQIRVRQTKVVPISTVSPPHTSSNSLKRSRESKESSSASYSKQFCKQRRDLQSPTKTSTQQPDKNQEVRDLHNTMERQRRVELKDALEEVKLSVPSIAQSERASKLTILTKATDYCNQLSSRSVKLRRDLATEKNRSLQLKKKLRALQAELSPSVVM